MRKIIVPVCLFALALTVIILSVASSDSDGASVVDSGECGHGITWTYYDDGLLVIEGDGWMYEYGNDNYPWKGHSNSIKNIHLVGNFLCPYGFYNMNNLETIRVGPGIELQENLWIREFNSFRELIIEARDVPSNRIAIQLGHDYGYTLENIGSSFVGEDMHMTFYKVTKKEIPPEYKKEVKNGTLLLFKVNDLTSLQMDAKISVLNLYNSTDKTTVKNLDTGKIMESHAHGWELTIVADQTGYILVSVNNEEMIPYSTEIAIIIAMIGIVGSIIYYFKRIRRSDADDS